MKYLITGGDGFLGSHLCEYFLSENIDFVATSRKHADKNYINTGDLTEYSRWSDLFQNIDIVIHTAAKAHDFYESESLKESFVKINLNLTKELARRAKENHVKKFIFISTIKVNGDETGTQPFRADDEPHPTDNYGLSKLMAEQELLKLHQDGVFEVVIIRPCLIYGKGVKANMNSLLNLIQKQLPLPFGAIKNKRSLISIENLMSLILCCARSKNASGQIFLASDNSDLSLTEMIQALALALKVKVYLIPIPQWALSAALFLIGKSDYSTKLFANLQVDITKTTNLLGWKPPYTTRECFEKMLAY
jgi:nucleoside-diphosphate-sugar epimerase